MEQKRVHLGKAVVMAQHMDDEMASYAVSSADGALECIFQERVSHKHNTLTFQTREMKIDKLFQFKRKANEDQNGRPFLSVHIYKTCRCSNPCCDFREWHGS